VKNLKLSTITLAAVMLSSTIIMSISNANGQTPASSWTPPTNGTFVCWNLADTDCWWMLPYPGPTCDDCGVYYLGTTNGVSWYGFYDSNCLARADQGLANGSFSANEAEGGSDGPMGPQYGTNDLWLEITRVRMAAGLADLLLHGTSPGGIYQLESTTDLRQPPLEWSLGPIKFGDDNTNVTAFSDFPICGNLQMFFRAHHAGVRLRIEPIQDAIEPIFGTNWQN